MTTDISQQMRTFAKEANETFGNGSAFIIADGLNVEVDVIPTGVPAIDNMIGVGGIPRGRITEIFGKEATGKTTLCFHTIAQAQWLNIGCAFIDAEHSVSFQRMESLGVDPSKLVFSQPDSGERALDLIEMMVRSNKFGLICVDSVAALTPQIEIEKDMGDSVMGVHAKLMSQAMRKLTAPTSKANVALIFTNQTRANIGGYGSPEVTTGGNALKFYASLRIKMQFMGQIKSSTGQRISGKYKATAIKNKVFTPFLEATFEIDETGISSDGNFIDELVENNVITKSGAFYKLHDQPLAQGKAALTRKLREMPELVTELKELLVIAKEEK